MQSDDEQVPMSTNEQSASLPPHHERLGRVLAITAMTIDLMGNNIGNGLKVADLAISAFAQILMVYQGNDRRAMMRDVHQLCTELGMSVDVRMIPISKNVGHA